MWSWADPNFSVTKVPLPLVGSSVGLIIQGIALICLLILRIILMVRTKGRCLFAPFYNEGRGTSTRDFTSYPKLSKRFAALGSNSFGGGLHGLMYVI